MCCVHYIMYLIFSPLPLEVTAVGESVIKDNLEVFEKNGFRFSFDEEGMFTLFNVVHFTL